MSEKFKITEIAGVKQIPFMAKKTYRISPPTLCNSCGEIIRIGKPYFTLGLGEDYCLECVKYE